MTNLSERRVPIMAHKGVQPEVQPSGQSYSGYTKCNDYNFVSPPPDRLVCKICHFPCYETQLTECCGHVYCQSCVEKEKTDSSRSQIFIPHVPRS